MTTAVEHLTAALAALDIDITVAQERLTTLQATRADLATLVRSMTSGDAPTPSPAPSAQISKARQVGCPDCGEMFPNRNAVDSHRRTEHPASAPKPTSKPTPSKRPNTSTVDYADVAAAMRRIRAAGKPLQKTLADEYQVPLTTVKNWIGKVYKLGLDSPDGGSSGTEWTLPERRTSLEHEADTVYRCSSCDEERATLDGLGEHTWAQHQRPPKITEKLAVRPKVAA